jgi:hypothetical protein
VASDVTDDALMAALRDMTGCLLEPQIRAQVSQIEHQGLRVTVYEVRETGALLMIAHASETPSMAAIRRAYRQTLESVESFQ